MTCSDHKERADRASREAAEQRTSPHAWRFLDALLHLRTFKALSYRDYRLIWYGQIFVSMGTWMDEVTRGWLMYELTNSAVHLGLVRGIQSIPFLLLSPVAGGVADRYSRKMQMVASQVVNVLVFAVTALLILTGRIRPWHIYATAFLMATAQTFMQPARAAMISDAVPPNHLTNAIGLNAMIFNVARTTGPALAGMLIVKFGTGGTYAMQAIFFVLATLWTIQLRPAHVPTRAEGLAAFRESFGQSIIEGWKFSWRNETVRAGLLALMVVSLFIVPFRTLLPVFARDLLGVGASGQGFLLTAMGIGALCSAVLVASAGDKLPRGEFILGSVTLYGFIVMIIAASRWFPLSLMMMVITGFCTVHSHSLVQTVVQSYSPAEFRGRTMALYNISQVVMTVGSMAIGALSTFVGAPWAVASMGAMGVLAMMMMYVTMPQARHIS